MNQLETDIIHSIKFFEGKAKDNNPILIIEKNGNPTYLFSRYNPVKEGEKQAEKFSVKEEHIVIIGGGSPYFLKEVLKKIDRGKRVFYIEPYPELLSFSAKNLQMEEYINYFDFFTIGIPQNDDFEQKIQEGIDIVKLDKIDYIIHPIINNLLRDEIDIILEKINNTALQLVYDFVTRMKDGKRVQKNILNNINIISNSPSINRLKNLFSDIPAIIVSAGPSLDKNLPYIKDMETRGIIISTDTALKPLLSFNIKPHFVVAGDPSYFNYLHLKNIKIEKSYLITEPSVDSRVFNGFENRVFLTIFDKPLLELLEKYIGEISHLNTWGTVASLALEIAHFTGASPIFFIGQDFSYPYKLKYTRETIYDNDWIYKNNNQDYIREKTESIINMKDKKTVKDIFDRELITNYKLEKYKEYLNSILKKDKKYINITEGGYFNSIYNSTSWFEILKLKRQKRDFFKEIERIHSNSIIKNSKKKIERFLKIYIKNFKNILLKLKENLELFDKPNLSAEAISEAYDYIYSNPELAEIIENYTQEPIYQLLKDQNRYKKDGDFDKLKKAYKVYYNKLLLLTEEIIDDFTSSLNILKKDMEDKK
jgi:hypothetical protein